MSKCEIERVIDSLVEDGFEDFEFSLGGTPGRKLKASKAVATAISLLDQVIAEVFTAMETMDPNPIAGELYYARGEVEKVVRYLEGLKQSLNYREE